MLLYIEDEIMELDNEQTSIKKYNEIVSELLNKKNAELKYIIVDGEMISQDIGKYLADHINTIDKVVLVTDITSNLVKDTINTTEQYLYGAIPQVLALSSEFYVNPVEKTWLTLVDLFEGIQWILETVMKIDGINYLENLVVKYVIWNEYVQTVSELHNMLPELQVAMESQDNVMIGDLLLYEIIPVFQKMLESLGFLVSKEGNLHAS